MGQEQEIQRFVDSFRELKAEVQKVIVGHDEVIEDVLVGLFCGGHVLLEGVPGLGKTLLVKTLSEGLDLAFSRIQFTPGPIFAHIVLADEINRATPKTQSALLEGMQEGHVTVAGISHQLPNPFFVLATQNPIEMEGTYPLPEAQLD